MISYFYNKFCTNINNMSDIDGGENKRNARLWMLEEKNLDESDVRRLVKAK